MAQGLVNISDLPDGGQIESLDFWPALRQDGVVYKVKESTNEIVLFAKVELSDGQAVTIDSSGKVLPAIATTLASSNVIGFVNGNTLVDQEVSFYNVYATVSNTLIVGQQYYLSDVTAGAIMNVLPSSGHYIVPIGTAITTNAILINIRYPSQGSSNNFYIKLENGTGYIALE